MARTADADGSCNTASSGAARTQRSAGAPGTIRRGTAGCSALPKTRSGKILRKTMRGIADGKDEPIPSTIEDATVLDKLRPILTKET